MDPKKVPNLLAQIKWLGTDTSSQQQDYRIGDIIYRKGWPPLYDEWKTAASRVLKNRALKGSFLDVFLTEYQPPQTPNTLLEDKKALSAVVNEIFDRLIAQHPGRFKVPLEDELVIQIRAGDVIEHDWFLKKDYVDLIRGFTEHHGISRVTFVTALFFANVTMNQNNQTIFSCTEDKVRRNLKGLAKVFHRVAKAFPHLPMRVISSRNPDVDLLYMIRAKHLIRDVGGFGDFVEDVRAHMS